MYQEYDVINRFTTLFLAVGDDLFFSQNKFLHPGIIGYCHIQDIVLKAKGV
jgi:hypothetical protein